VNISHDDPTPFQQATTWMRKIFKACPFHDLMSLLFALLLVFVPWIELNGAIPVALALGFDPVLVLVSAIILNSLLFFPVYFGLEKFYKHAKHIKIINKTMVWTEKRGHKVRKYGPAGLAVFIAIPGPFTGVYSATLLAWLFRMNWKHAFVGIFVGVICAAIIVWAISIGALAALRFLL